MDKELTFKNACNAWRQPCPSRIVPFARWRNCVVCAARKTQRQHQGLQSALTQWPARNVMPCAVKRFANRQKCGTVRALNFAALVPLGAHSVLDCAVLPLTNRAAAGAQPRHCAAARAGTAYRLLRP